MLLDDETRELEPDTSKLEEAQKTNDILFESGQLTDENKKLKKKVTDLTILIYQVLDQDESDFFDDNVRVIERQNIRRMLKARFPLTPEMVDIVNKSKEQQQQPIS